MELFKKPPISLEEEKLQSTAQKRPRNSEEEAEAPQQASPSPYILVDPTETQYALRFCTEALAQIVKRMDLERNPLL